MLFSVCCSGAENAPAIQSRSTKALSPTAVTLSISVPGPSALTISTMGASSSTTAQVVVTSPGPVSDWAARLGASRSSTVVTLLFSVRRRVRALGELTFVSVVMVALGCGGGAGSTSGPVGGAGRGKWGGPRPLRHLLQFLPRKFPRGVTADANCESHPVGRNPNG